MKPLLAFLFCATLACPTWAQRTTPRQAPTRSLVRELPSANGRKPVPVTAQEPTQDGLDADAAAVFRPREDIDPADVVLSNGEVRLERSELFLLGRAGLNFELVRRYRSQLDYSGPLGYGWDFNYNERLYDAPGGDKLRLNGAGHVDTWTRNGDGSFNAPAGFFGTLVENSDASFTLREPGGMKHHYRPKGRLSALEDRHGNRIRFNHVKGQLVSAMDVFGRVIRFFYEASPDGRERLARVRDFTGREIVYTYDTNGDLVAARSPIIVGTSTGNDFPAGTTERYAYHDDHNLEAVTFPNEVAVGGPPAMQYAYDDQDRVTSWMLGGTNASGVPAGGTVAFAYQMLNAGTPLGDPSVARLRTTVVERNGNSYDVEVNELQHRLQSRRFTRGLRPGEPPFYLTRWDHDADGQLTRLIRPRGNGELFTYDNAGSRAAQRDLVEWRRVADAVTFGGPEEDLVWTYAYDPVYHQRVSTTDPRENSSSFVPPIGSNAPGRYTTRRFVDYQEGSDPIPDAVPFGISLGSFPRGLGDLNADGRTDQMAGNVVRREGAAVTLEAGSPLALELGSTTQEIVTETWWNDFGQRVGEIDPEGNMTTWSYNAENDPAGPGGGPAPLGLMEGGYVSLITRDALDTYRRSTAESLEPLPTQVLPNDRGAVISVVDARGVRSDFERNANDKRVRRIRGADISQALATLLLIDGGPLQHRDDTLYDANGEVIAMRKENVAAVSATDVGDWLDLSNSRDILNRKIETTHEIDSTTTAVTGYDYDPSGNQTGVTSPEGHEDRTLIDERHLIYQRILAFGSPEAGTYMFGYDDDGNLRDNTDAADTDGDGQPEQVQFGHSPFGWMISRTEPLGFSVQATYDPVGNLTSTVEYGHPAGDPTGTPVRVGETRYAYDEQDQLYQTDELRFLPVGTSTVRPVDHGDGARTTRYQVDALGDLRFETDDRNFTLELRYDGARRLVRETDALGNAVAYEHDGNGNVTCMTETDVQPDGLLADQMYATTFSFDQLGRKVREVDSGGSTKYWAWDSLGNISTTWDARGPLLPADPWGISPKPGQSGPLNDHGNRVAFAWNGLGLKIRAEYDLNEGGEAANGPDADNPHNSDARSTNLYGYDRDGLQTSQTDDVGNTTSWAYSARHWITENFLATGATITTARDLDGNLTGRTWANGYAVSYTNDARGRRILETRTASPGGRMAGPFEKQLGYDGRDNLVAWAVRAYSSAPPPPVITMYGARAFDARNDLAEEMLYGSLVTSFRRDGNGNVIEETQPDGRAILKSYDAGNRPTSLDCSVNGAIVAATYYLGRGKRVLRQEFGNGTVRENQFDDRREMTEVRHVLPPISGSMYFVLNSWNRDRKGNIVDEMRSTGLNRSFGIGSTGSLDRESVPTVDYEFLRQGNGILRQEDLIDMTGTYPLNYSANALGAHVAADGSPQASDARGNQLERTLYGFTYNQDQWLILADNSFQGPLKEFYYHVNGRLGLTVQPIFGSVRFRFMSWGADDHVAQEWLNTPTGPQLIRTYYTFNGEVVGMDEENSPITSDLVTILHQDPRSGPQARSFLFQADYMANGYWDFDHTDFTAGGLELNTSRSIDGESFKGLRFEPAFNAYTNDHGGIYFANTQRMGQRQDWGPSEQGYQRELGNGYNAFSSGNSVNSKPSQSPELRRFTVERGLDGNCRSTTVRFGGDAIDNVQFFELLQRYFVRVDNPRPGDLAVFDPFEEGISLLRVTPSERYARLGGGGVISHVAFVVQVPNPGEVLTLGRGRCKGPVEFADVRAFGNLEAEDPREREPDVGYYRLSDALALRHFEQVKVNTLINELRRLPEDKAGPVADELLRFFQERTYVGASLTTPYGE